MRDNFDAALKLVLVHEGGFVNDPQDPGGPTNMGITQSTLSDFLGRPATIEDVRDIDGETVAEIYRRSYWALAQCDHLPVGLDYAVFDFAVNSGVSRAVKMLQKVVGAKQDGALGVKTLAAVKASDIPVTIKRLCDERMKFLRGLGRFRRFGKGWTRRVMGNTPGSQASDIGVIDRAVLMYQRRVVPAPLMVMDGANAKALDGNKGGAMLKGHKTYIVAGVTVIGAVAAYLVGDADLATTVQLVVTAVLSATVRNGIAVP